MGDFGELKGALPTLKTTLPTRTFEQRLMLEGERRTAELVTFGGGHTECDALLCLPAEGIAFVGDLVQVGTHVKLDHGHPHEWVRILAQIESLGL